MQYQLFVELVLFVATTFARKRKRPHLTGIFQNSSNKCAMNVYKLGQEDIIGQF